MKQVKLESVLKKHRAVSRAIETSKVELFVVFSSGGFQALINWWLAN